MTEHDPKDQQGLPDDRELEEFLARRSELSRRHRESAQEQAPPELDAKVLETAREDLRARRPRRLLRWDNPLALAASALLVVGLGWLTLPRSPPVVQGELVQPSSAPVAVEADQARKPLAEVAANRATGELKDELKKEKQAEAPAVTPAPAAKTAPPAAANLAQPMQRPFPLQAQKPAPPAADAAGAPPAEPAPAVEARDKAEFAVTPAPPAAPPPPSLPTPAEDAMAASQSNAPAAAAPAPALPAMRLEAAPDPCASLQRQPAQRQAQPEQRLDTSAWLDRIRELRKTDESAAQAELACFAARRPRAEVPEDLRPLLPRR